jgi:hypothetical protein
MDKHPQHYPLLRSGPNSKLFGSKLHATIISKPGHAPGFLLRAPGMALFSPLWWRGE